jgi:2-phosphosulfolactate phosphatase
VRAELVAGRLVVHRTSNGTRGLAAAAGASQLFAAAAVNVSATARAVAARRIPGPVTLVCTGRTSEDRACAKALAALLAGRPLDAERLREAVRRAGLSEHRDASALPAFAASVETCAAVDRYDFALAATPGPHGVTLHATPIPAPAS